MKLISWNVNSIRVRLQRLQALLERHQPDVVCLQETKVTDDKFPALELRALGYQAATWGQRAYNGVAILTREKVDDVTTGFTDNPAPEQARVIAARLGDLNVVSVYVVNGKTVGHEAYELKLRWLDTLTKWLASTYAADQQLIVMGDFNIAPSDEDVYDPVAWRDQNLCSPAERTRLATLLEWGLVDLHADYRRQHGPLDEKRRFTWWDYRHGAFHKNLGLRIDLALATASVTARCKTVDVDRDERKPSFGPEKPSDHAPLVVELSS